MDKSHYISYSKAYKSNEKKQYLPEYLIWILEHQNDPNKKRANYRAMYNQK